MILEQALELIDRTEVDKVLAFWDPDRHAWPPGEGSRRARIAELMRDDELVEDRMGGLPSRLRDLLRYVVRSMDWRRGVDLQAEREEDLPVASFEAAAVAAALADRGLLVRRGGGAGRSAHYVVPLELGESLERVFAAARRPAEASFSLRRYLRSCDRNALATRLEDLGLEALAKLPAAELRAALTEPEAVLARVAAIRDPELRAFLEGLPEHGGFLDAPTRRRLGLEVDRERLQAWGRELEHRLLGAFEDRELVNQGLAVGEGWLAVFVECSGALLEGRGVDEAEAEEGRVAAPDGFADLRGIVRELEEAPFRVRKNGDFYRNGVRRLARAALSPAGRPLGPEADLEFLLGMMADLELVRRDDRGQLVPTAAWRRWIRRPAEERGEDLLRYCRRAGETEFSPLHAAAARRLVFDLLRDRGVGVWMPFELLVHSARNEHLAEAARPEFAFRYQDRHKRLPFPPLASPEAMRQSLESWVATTPARLGLVELSYREGDRRPFAVRLSPFGGRVLGVRAAAEPSSGAGLVVSSDFEVVLFPEHAGFDLIELLGRFAERTKADYAIHYRLTRESVQGAAAADFGESEILGLLETHSAHALPPNVAEAVRDWCGKTLRLEARRTWVLESSSAENLDRALETPELRRIQKRRLAPTILELAEDPGTSGASAALRERGIFL